MQYELRPIFISPQITAARQRPHRRWPPCLFYLPRWPPFSTITKKFRLANFIRSQTEDLSAFNLIWRNLFIYVRRMCATGRCTHWIRIAQTAIYPRCRCQSSYETHEIAVRKYSESNENGATRTAFSSHRSTRFFLVSLLHIHKHTHMCECVCSFRINEIPAQDKSLIPMQLDDLWLVVGLYLLSKWLPAEWTHNTRCFFLLPLLSLRHCLIGVRLSYPPWPMFAIISSPKHALTFTLYRTWCKWTIRLSSGLMFIRGRRDAQQQLFGYSARLCWVHSGCWSIDQGHFGGKERAKCIAVPPSSKTAGRLQSESGRSCFPKYYESVCFISAEESSSQ